ncbi:hypothetical protein JZO70_21510 [Enterococcus sp. 669A]|uniref:Uncharacterized protein n=1 Tax=Candidatus Enterococcus moelleringii TaxID=2815325 RepID=A0ABS3LK79_9ENTE|nr:hypothetical protein [Enterococcus sp. 669A]MBO1308764.1 hypothetical protein [Enterococcus sp. 669A]
MDVYKTIGKFWVAGWLIIGVPYCLIAHVSFGELVESFIFVTIFLGVLFGFGEIRDYIRKRASED